MELDLTDATQIRITIRHLVQQSGLVDDDKAAAVKEQLAVEKAANEGDGDALYEMGRQFQAKVLRDTDEEEDSAWLYEQLDEGQNHWSQAAQPQVHGRLRPVSYQGHRLS